LDKRISVQIERVLNRELEATFSKNIVGGTGLSHTNLFVVPGDWFKISTCPKLLSEPDVDSIIINFSYDTSILRVELRVLIGLGFISTDLSFSLEEGNTSVCGGTMP
jgi:hypothetical protein